MANPLTMKLEQFTSFTALERTRLDELLRHPAETYRKSQMILREGDSVDHVHLVTESFAARSKTLRDGSRQLMAFLLPGDLCDVEVFVLRGMDHDIVATTETTCALIPTSTMRAILTESPSRY